MKKLSTILLLFALTSCAAQPGFKVLSNNGKALTNGNKKKLVIPTLPVIPTTPPPTDTTTASLYTPLASYYFSESLGDDSRTALQAHNPATPWKRTAKLSTISVQPGTDLVFMDGSYGATMSSPNQIPLVLYANWAGTASLPVRVRAYPGHHPVFTSLATVSSPTAASGYSHVYDYSVSPQEEIVAVYIDNVLVPVVRYPKRTETGQRGYLVNKTGTGHGQGQIDTLTTISGNMPAENIVGADLNTRCNQYIIASHKIISQTGTSFGFENMSSASIEVSYGFFFANHVSFLSLNTEWAYDRTTHKLRVFFADDNPGAHSVQVATANYLVWDLGGSNITFSGITLKGANVDGILLQGASHTTIQNCTIDGMGRAGIWQVNGAANTVVENNTITNCYAEAVDLANEPNCIVRNNDIRNISMYPGAHRWTWNTSDNGNGIVKNMPEGVNGGGAVIVGGSTGIVANNTIHKAGSNGIIWNGANTQVTGNVIDSACETVSDVACIYSFKDGQSYSAAQTRLVQNNTCIVGFGDAGGTNNLSYKPIYGIYNDDGTRRVNVNGNLVIGAKDAGIYNHHTQYINAQNNTLFDCEVGYFTRYGDNSTDTLPVGNVFSNNLVVSRQSGQIDSSLTVINQGVFAGVTPSQTATFSNNLYYGFDASRDLIAIYNTKGTTQSVSYTGGPFNNIVNNVLIGASPLSLGAFLCIIGFKTVSPP